MQAARERVGERDQFSALPPIRERVLDAEHPCTLTTSPTGRRFVTSTAGTLAGDGRDVVCVVSGPAISGTARLAIVDKW